MARIFCTAILLAIGLSACAPAAPTVDPAQIQASAVAAASTMIALTVAAMPTNTLVPPTPVPSPTPLPPPTLAAPPTAVASPTKSSSGNCNGPLDLAEAGPSARVVINNEAKAQITFVMGFSRKNTFGQCGSVSAVIGRGQSASLDVPQVRTNLGDACYWVYVWVNDPKTPKTLSPSEFYCIDNALKWTFTVSPTNVRLSPP